MYTDVTYQDWENTPDYERLELLLKIVEGYKSSADFKSGLIANQYFRAENPEVANKYLLRPTVIEIKDENGKVKKQNRQEKIDGNRVFSSFFSRFVIQQNQYLLANGVTLDNEETKKRLGFGFDKALERLGEKALTHGVAWGFWNVDHLEVIEAVKDVLSGAVALLDERTSEAMALVQFWQLSSDRPLYIRLYTVDGVVEYRKAKDEENLSEIAASRRAYIQHTITDVFGTQSIGESNYGSLPVIPLWASEEKRSELTPAIKSKIDLYDRILSDFGDNLDRACDVYWVLNNFGGTMSDIAETLAAIERLKAVANMSDGTGNASTAEPHTIEVPYAARQAALDILQKQLYSDYMALSMDELTGGSLTNVAIETAMTNLNLKADRYEWQCFSFVQKVLRLIGIKTEEIKFKRQQLTNRSETVNDISLMRDYIDQETALKLNPYIDQEEIQEIIDRLAAESMSATPVVTTGPTEPKEEEGNA